MTHRSNGSNDRGPAIRRPSPPRMELLYEVYHPFSPETATVLGGTHLLVPAGGTRFEGPRMSGQHLPPTIVVQTIHANGIMELDGVLGMETDDGHRLFGRSLGIASIAPENALALAAGEAFDPEAFYMRHSVRFEAADDGPYRWLNRCLCVGKSVRLPESFHTTVWQLL